MSMNHSEIHDTGNMTSNTQGKKPSTADNDNNGSNNNSKCNRATGVTIRQGSGELAQVHASQVILCAGALGSTQILHASISTLTGVEHVGESF